jgi:class 3 adenylate cyclase
VTAIKPRNKRWRHHFTWFDAVLASWGIVFALFLQARGTLTGLEARTYDQRLQLAARLGREPDRSGAVLLPIDDWAVQRYGRWPWARDRWAPILSVLSELGARGVFFDIEFPEPSDPVFKRDAGGRSFQQMVQEEFPDLETSLGAGKVVRFFSDPAATADPRTAAITLLEGVGTRLSALKGRIVQAVQNPDLDMSRALVRAAESGTPVSGVCYVVGGTTEKEAHEAAALDQHIRELLGPATTAGTEATAVVSAPAPAGPPAAERLSERELYARKLVQVLVRNPLAGPEAPEFRAAGLGAREVERELVSMRDIVLGHVLDLVLARDAAMPEPHVAAAAAARLGLKDPGPLAGWIHKLLTVARARATVLRRFLIPVRDTRPLNLPAFRSFVPPIPELAAAYSGLSISTLAYDPDGTARRLSLVWKLADGLIPSPTLLMFLYRVGLDPSRPDEIARRLSIQPGPSLRVDVPGAGTVDVPVDDRGRMLIRFRGTYRDALQKVPLSMVISYIGLKRDRADYFDRVAFAGGEHRRVAAYARAAAELARRPEAAPQAPPRPPGAPEAAPQAQRHASSASGDVAARRRYTFDELAAAARDAGEILPGMDAVDLEEPEGTAGVPAGATTRTAVEWKERAERRLQEMERSHADVIAKQVERFQQLPEAERRARLSRPGSAWPRVLAAREMLSARECERAREQLTGLLQGRIAIIGAAHTGNTDIAPTPLEEKAPNFGLHAHGLSTLMSGRYILRPDPLVATWLPTCAVGLALGLVLPAVGILAGAVWTAGIIMAYGLLAVALLALRGVWLDVVAPGTGILATYVCMSTYRYFKEEKKKHEIKGMLDAYVDRRAVDQFLEHPELWKELGGATCEITAFFSDIEGFTSISEILTAEELSAMLTDYLSPMTDIILDRGGVRDKYIGDAIVAFWGAPLHLPDHAVQGCLACVEQMERLAQLKSDPALLNDPSSWLSRLKAAGKTLNARIGLNTGLAKVGNFGSLKNRNYTMIGDTVNLAARLEGANKAFGTYAMISEFVYAKARDAIEARPLDSLRVKGKLQPVTVFELMGAKGKLSDKLHDVRDRYLRARTLYLERRFDEAIEIFESALAIRPEDGPTKTLLARCRRFLGAPPPADWDGVYELTEK